MAGNQVNNPVALPPYTSLVDVQKIRNPCVSNLADFLHEPPQNLHCRIRLLEFNQGGAAPTPTNVDQVNLAAVLTAAKPATLLGRLFLIEDLTSNVVETFGSIINIDPLFFASHLDTPSQDINRQAPDKATLPSRLKNKDYVNIHYHRTIVFNCQMPDEYLKLRRDINIHRKVAVLTPIKKRRIGLAQHCVSIYRTTRTSGDWIALILTDPEISNRYKSPNGILSYASELFAGGYEDFLPPRPLPPTGPLEPQRSNLLDDLLYYFAVGGYPFPNGNPTLLAFARCPLQIVAREWVNYVAVMSHSVKQYEYDSKDFKDYKNIEVNLKELQRWRRRAMASEQKIRAATSFLRYSRSLEAKPDRAQWDPHLEDWAYVGNDLRTCGRTLDHMVSVSQILDARRSVDETKATTKLTTLALLFFPLSLFASIFSMADRFSPGKGLFWVYFVVAVPVCLVLYVLVRPPQWVKVKWKESRLRKPWQKIKDRWNYPISDWRPPA